MVNNFNLSSQGCGIPLVFIHGWGVNAAIWQPIADKLSTQFEVITVDLPGFATNNHVVIQPYTIENIAQLIASAVNKPAIYIGWSLGGLVATEIALTYSKNVLGLITVASSPCFVAEPNWPGIKPDVLKNFHQQLANNAKKTIQGFLKIQAMGSPNVRQDIKQISQLVMQHPLATEEVLDQSLSLLETSDYRNKLKQVSQPFLRLYGRLDGLVPKSVIASIDELTPQSTSFIFQQSSHAPFISQPSEFIEEINSWIEKHQIASTSEVK